MKVVIEVGANNGRDTKRLLNEYDCDVFSFEPVPKLYNKIISDIQDDRLHMINAAVGKYTETRDFNITVEAGPHPAHGSSSLFNFRDDIQERWKRDDFYMGETIKTKVWALEDFIVENGITEILHLHCDAQGNDLNVLKGLGDQAGILNNGLIEVTDQLNLYDNNENTKEQAMQWLDENGFVVTKTKHNDKLQAELNIWFRRK